MKILHLEDNLYDAELISETLRDANLLCEITVVQTRAEYQKHLEQTGWDLILSDYGLPRFDGISALKLAVEKQAEVPFVFVTGALGEDVAVETLKMGASDYVVKHKLGRLVPVVLRAQREAKLVSEHRQGTRDLQRTEEALRETESQSRDSEARYRSLVESIDEYSIIRLDSTGHIASWTPSSERINGYTAEEILEKHCSCLLTPEDVARGHSEELLRIAASLGRVTEEGPRMRKDGTRFWANVSITAIRDGSGQLSGYSKVTRDITERKQIEDLLAVTHRKAEEANQAKSDFLAMVSHEIRTPINAMLGMADVLSESQLDTEQRQCVEVFIRAGSSLMTLVNDILDLAKIEAGHLHLEETEFEIRKLIDQTVELISPKAHAKGIGCRVDLSPELTPWVSGDPTRLRQVLINLLGNSVKFTASGEIVLTVRQIDTGASSVEFAVSDTGIGIPADQLESIFENFKQGDASITRKYGGSGLGLGISRKLVNEMGGRLSVTSVVGKGTTFRFTLPFQSVVKPVANAAMDIHGLRGQWIAFIPGRRDLDVADRPVILEALESLALETREFPSPDKAFESVASPSGERPCSLMIVDHWVTGEDGFRDILALHPRLPIVVLSADRSCGANLKGADRLSGHVTKPVNPRELVRAVLEALQQAPSNPTSPAFPQPPGTTQVSPSRKSLRILIAEDSPDNQLVMRLYLKGGPHAFTFVENGQEALHSVSASEFDIVLMDLQMPVMDGLTATRRIREIERTHGRAATPIVALSANARPEDIKMSLEAGCDGHLSKPISKRFLMSALEQYGKVDSGEAEDSVAAELALLIPSYLDARRNEVQELPKLLRDADFGAIRRIAHQLKGSGASYGFPDLSALGRAMQASAEAADADALNGQIHQLQDFLANA